MNTQTVANGLALLFYLGLIYVVVRHGLRGNRAGRAFCAYLVTMVLWETAYLLVCLSSTPQQARLWYRIILAVVSGQFIVYLAFTRALLLRDGSSLTTRIGFCAWAVTATVGSVINGPAVYADVHRDAATGLFVPTFGPLLPLLAAPNYVFLGLATLDLIQASRRSKSSLQRSRMQYLLLGVTVVVLGSIANFVPRLQPYPVDVVANIVNALIIAYAILRYQLLDIRVVIRKGILYSIPTAIIGTTYFLVLYLAITLFHALTGQILLSLATAAVTALVAQPLKDKVQSWVDRLFFRERYDSSLMLQELSHTAASILDLNRLTGMILDRLQTNMHIAKAAVLLRAQDGDRYDVVAQRGLGDYLDLTLRADHPVVQWLSRQDETLGRHGLELLPQFRSLWRQEREGLQNAEMELFVPLKASGKLVGILAAGRKLSDQPYSREDQRTLTTLANQTAVAIENAHLYEAVRRDLDQRTRMEGELQVLNATLEQRVRQRTFDLLLVNELSQKLGCAADLRELVRVLLEDLHRAVPYDAAAALLAIDDRCEVLVRPVRRLRPELRDQIMRSLFRAAGRLGGYMPDAREVHRAEMDVVEPTSPPLAEVGSSLDLPLVVSEQEGITGLLLLVAEQPHAFSEDHVRLLQTGASQAAIAIRRLLALLVAEQQRQGVLLERLPEGALLLNSRRRIVLANPVGRQYLQVLGRARVGDVLDTLGDQGIPGLLASPSDGFDGHEIRTPASADRVFEFMSQRMETGPQAGGWVVILRDVTERKRAEQHRAALEEQLRQAQKMEAVGLLAGGVAHEFNNLLTVIQGNAEIAMMQLEPPDSPTGELSTVLRTAQRAGALTQRLLAFGRRQVLHVQGVDLNALVPSFVQMLQPLIGEQIQVSMNLAVGLPTVRADRNALEQTLMNLTLNARDAMPDGGQLCFETAHRVMRGRRSGLPGDDGLDGYVRVSVVDSGIGIDQLTQKHLFEPFFTTKEVGKGTGLGLAMVYGIVKQHGGWIEVTSQVGHGTRFDIYLPLAREAALEDPTPVKVGPPPRGSETVLLAEDEPDVRDFAQRVLEGLGYRVLLARDGQDAVDLFLANQDRVQLVILDVVMPRVSGPQAYEVMRSARSRLPALFITGYGAEMVKLPRELVTQVQQLHKPFGVTVLAHKVRDAIDRPKTPHAPRVEIDRLPSPPDPVGSHAGGGNLPPPAGVWAD